jgi:MarR family 2-MHQ and catechol resistance regulon transcriptional repressor
MPTHYQGTPEEILALDAFIKFTRANSSLEARLLGRGSLDGLTLTQFGVLETLFHLGPLCQGELSQKLLKSTGNMTLVLDNLEKYGLVRRVRTLEDRRMVRVELTGQGRERIEQVLPQQIAVIVEEMSALTPEEQAELGRLAKKLGLGRAAGATLGNEAGAAGLAKA